MKIAILTLGTRGDVQPFIALGKALQARDHDVVLGAPENAQSWIESHGLTYRSIGVDMQAFVESQEARKVMGGNGLAMIRMWRKTIVPLTQRSLDAIWQVGHGADIIIFHPKTMGAVDVSEATGAALYLASPFPIFPTKSFPLFIFPGRYGPWLNRLSYNVLVFSRWAFRSTRNRWRREMLGLGKARVFNTGSNNTPPPVQLCAVSPIVLPNYPADDTENIHTTGYWFLDEDLDWRPDASLSAFLKTGAPPIYIGFGSMTIGDPARLAHTIVDGVKRAGVRAVIATGWGALQDIEVPDTIHIIKGAPHHLLFRHVAAAVHHGGAGTTGASLRAGLPTLICPLTLDQPFWGRQVYDLGCGPKPQSLKQLKAEKFAKGLTNLTQIQSYKDRATEIARAIEQDDGITRAVELIEAGIRVTELR